MKKIETRNRCLVKVRELWQAYQKAREANSQYSVELQTCHLYKELYTILGRTTTALHTTVNTQDPGLNSKEDGGVCTWKVPIVP